MTPTILSTGTTGAIVAALRKHLAWWLVPTAAFGLIGVVYSVFQPWTWQAAQGLLVRDEAAGGVTRQGRFDNPEAMKTALETIHEIARGRAVVLAALSEIGPPPGRQVEGWPTDDDVESAQGAIALKAPKGAEFGSTEMVYLTTTAPSRERALAFNVALCRGLDDHLRTLRNEKAASIIAELERTAGLAQADLDQSTGELVALETQVGSDLGELRTLNEQGAGDSNLRTTMNQIKEELRAQRTTQEANQQQLAHLLAARQDPDQVVGMPARFLESQPALARLKDGLVDAQLRTAEVLGTMNDSHPLAQAAMAAEQQVRQDLHDELAAAVAGAEAELKVSGALVQSLEAQLAEVSGRLDRLAALRAPYRNLVAEVEHRGQIVQQARLDLADARASQVAAQSSSLITRLGDPDAGTGPIGPGRTVLVLGSLAGGLVMGLGLVFLRSSPTALRGRRWGDYLGIGRRSGDVAQGRPAGDAQPGRRASDPRVVEAPVAANPGDRRAATDRRQAG